MDQELRKLIKRYENLKKNGQEQIKLLQVGSVEYEIQNRLNIIWILVLKDLREYADTNSHGNKNKT